MAAKGSPDAAGRWAARDSSAQGGSPARGGGNSGDRGDLHRLNRGMVCPGGWYTLGSRLSALGSRLSALGSRLSALGSRLSALGSRLSALGSRLSALGSRLSALGSRLSALGSRLSALGSRLSALGSRLSALGSRLSALGSRLSALGSRLSALGSRLSALGSRLSALGSRLSALGSRLSALGSRLSALGSLLIASSEFAPDVPSCGVRTAAGDCAVAGARPSTSRRSMRIDVRPFGESEGPIFDPHGHMINRNIRKSPFDRGAPAISQGRNRSENLRSCCARRSPARGECHANGQT